MRRAETAVEWRERARRAEELGFDVLVVPDHVVDTPSVGRQFAAIPAIMAAADATTRIRLSSLVLSNDYRNPVMLAKEIATIDALSGGRIELGLGAGWSRSDYAALGARFEPARVRTERLDEALLLITRLFTEERVDHAGRHYRVHGAQVLPRPTQHPHPPLVVGGHSELVLHVAARRAQIVSIGSPTRPRDGDIGPDALAARIAIVREAAAEQFGSIAIHLLNDIRVTDAGREAYAATAAQLRLPIATLERSPYFIYGGLATVAERVSELRERYGVTYVRVVEDQMERVAALLH